MSQQPSIARVVHYRLTEEQARQVNRRRTSSASIGERLVAGSWPIGAQAHIGEAVIEGETFPLIVTRTGSAADGAAVVNGQVLLDGNDTLWVQGAVEGASPGCWFWPPHVPAKAAAPAYVPAPELVAAAEQSVASASPEVLATAERLYVAYGAVTDGRSAVTGATLPQFSACSVLVRAGWLAAVRAVLAQDQTASERPAPPTPEHVWDAFAHRWYLPGAKGPAIGRSSVGA